MTQPQVTNTDENRIRDYHRALRDLIRAVEQSNTVRTRCRFCRMTSTTAADPTPELHNAVLRAKRVLMGIA